VVSGDGATYVRAQENASSAPLQRVFEGELTPVFSAVLASVPTLLNAADGSVLVQSEQGGQDKLHALLVDKSAPVPYIPVAAGFIDAGGAGAVYGSDETVYVPWVNASQKYGMYAFSPGGGGESVLTGMDEVLYVGADVATGLPWFCEKKFVSSAIELKRYNGGSFDLSASFSGAPSCTETVFQTTADGEWVLSWDDDTTFVTRWNPAGGIPSKPVGLPAVGAEVHLAGAELYAVWKCGLDGCTGFGWIGEQLVVLEDATAAFGLKVAVSPTGQLAAVYRKKKTGSGKVVALLLDKGTAAEAGLGNSTVTTQIKNVWLTPEKVLWTELFGNFGDGQQVLIFSAAAVSGGGTTNLDTQQQFVTSGQAELTTTAGASLLSIDGKSKGLYQLKGEFPTQVAEATSKHTILGESAGVPFVSYPVADGSFELSRLPKSGLEVVVKGLKGPPLYTFDDSDTGRLWFIYDTQSGSSFAYLDGGKLVDWKAGYTVVAPVEYHPSAAAHLWGARLKKASFEDNWTWCELPPSEACWTMDTSQTLKWAHVGPGGTAHAVYFDEDAAILWRNLETPN